MTQVASSEPLTLILKNGRRLVEDAELLFERQRYASATMLAIYALEEMGKHYQAKWRLVEEHSSKGRRLHRAKQGIVGAFYGSRVAIGAVSEILSRIGLPEGMAADVRYLRPVLDWLRGRHDGAELVEPFREGMLEIMGAAFSADPRTSILERAQRGEIEQTKRNAMYVDIGKLGEVTSNPETITRDIAAEWVEHARFMLDAARQDTARVVVDWALFDRVVADVANLITRERPFDRWQHYRRIPDFCPKCGVAQSSCDHLEKVTFLVEMD